MAELEESCDCSIMSLFRCQQNLYLRFYISENGDIPVKTAALKKVIQLILNGERLPAILMTVIRFVMPLEDHTIKKLLLVFWEIVPKTTSDGKLLQQMILVCDAYRKVSCDSSRIISH